MAWEDGALCRGSTVDFFDVRQREAALALCARCPVLLPCREAALARPPAGMVMAGLAWSEKNTAAVRVRLALAREAVSAIAITAAGAPAGALGLEGAVRG